MVIKWQYRAESNTVSIERVITDYHVTIVAVLLMEDAVGFFTQDLSLHIWDQKLRNNIKEVDINGMGVRLNSRPKAIILNDEDLFVLSEEGDMIVLTLKLRRDPDKSVFVFKHLLYTLNNIVQLRKQMKAVKFFERVFSANKGRHFADHRSRRPLRGVHHRYSEP
jgi:hypothetical protein